MGSGAVVGMLAATAVDLALNPPHAPANRREAKHLKNIEAD